MRLFSSEYLTQSDEAFHSASKEPGYNEALLVVQELSQIFIKEKTRNSRILIELS